MKKIFQISLFGFAILTSCISKDGRNSSDERVDSLTTKLQGALATQDSLFVLINDIADGMSQIKSIENIVATPGNLNGESASAKRQLRNDMESIQQALQQRRERLAELEAKLKNMSGKSDAMLKTIDNLKSQIAEQETQIVTLTNQLAAANMRIATLDAAVDSLTTTVVTEKAERKEAQQQARQLSDELNTCYYAIGTKSELQKNDIIKTGFLRKTKILEGEFEHNYFTSADKRTLTEIPLHSKKAKVITNQPKGSYEIIGDGGQKVLKILDATKFWSISNFLVIQVE